MTGTIGAHLVRSPQGFFSTSAIYPIRNGWVASDHRRFVAVEDIGLRRPSLDQVFLTLTGRHTEPVAAA